MSVFERRESEVRGYCRNFPTVFRRARGSLLEDEAGREYVDFFAGAGALSYGHNDPVLKRALLAYVESDGVTHSLDLMTTAKRRFLEAFEQRILRPRGLDYKVMFPGPTGTNAVEAAIKLARKVTGRTQVVAFTNGFHGMTLGSLALTGNRFKRDGAGVPLGHVTHLPFDGYFGDGRDTLAMAESLLADKSSGIEQPAAFVVETVQAEGGVNVASGKWMKNLAALARRHEALLIVDDIQVGCGRTGPFFSFEPFDLEPDIVCLSKSLSGYGLPLAITIFKREHDVWEPGEHNGTFRGHNPAFVTAAAALDRYWADDALTEKVRRDGRHVRRALEDMAEGSAGSVRGRGLIQGIAFPDPATAGQVSQAAFARGVIVETAGPNGEVLKLLPPLTIARDDLERGLEAVAAAVEAVTGTPVLMTAAKGGNGR
jgi:diaminobutyrate-2-oxoglutarate transaminase